MRIVTPCGVAAAACQLIVVRDVNGYAFELPAIDLKYCRLFAIPAPLLFLSTSVATKQDKLEIITMYRNLLTILLQLALASFAWAAPMTIESNTWQYGTGGGIIGLIVFILDIIFIGE